MNIHIRSAHHSISSTVAVLSSFLLGRNPGRQYDKVDLHSSSVCLLAAGGYCPDHGEVEGVNRPSEGRWQCWCGQTIILKTEERRIAARGAAAALAAGPLPGDGVPGAA